MTERWYKVRGIDPLLFRDGKPFSKNPAESTARTLPLPLPGTLAGFLRTQLGNRAGWNWKTDGPAKALATRVHAPLLLRNDEIVFRAPADAVVHMPEGTSDGLNDGPEITPQVMCLRPMDNALDGAACDLPVGLQPLCITRSAKPDSGHKYWPRAYMENWLSELNPDRDCAPAVMGEPPTDDRVHVAINADSGIAEEGRLFGTRMLGFETHSNPYRFDGKPAPTACWSLLARVRSTENIDQAGPGLLGGERRIAVIEPALEADWPACPQDVEQAITGATRIRLILATPAIFKNGWVPGWLDKQRAGSPPCLPGVQLKLISAAVPRREPVSGWDYANRGPKPVRWMVPAGAVYFFEVGGGDAGTLAANGWLEAVSDEEQDRFDGYGLALWGVWDYAAQKENA